MENTKLQKPIMIAMNDFKESVVKLINESEMPMAIVNMLLKDILMQSGEVEKQQYEIALKQYNSDNKTENLEIES